MQTRLTRIALAVGMATAAAWAQQTATATYTYNGLPVPIFTDSADVISLAELVVPRALKMTKVTVQVQIQYPNSGDLRLYLFSPDGTRTILLEHDCSVANIVTTFDDAAPTSWKDFCPAEAGRGPFKSDQPLSNFNNDSTSFGIWRLTMENNSSDSRSGWLNAFSLTITGTTQVTPTISTRTIVNAASLTGGGTIAPGELTSIFGLGLGPSAGVAAPAGALPTTLGGTTVTIGGTAVPLSYASAFRVDFQAPYSLTPGSTVTAQVSVSNQSSASVTLNIVDAVPGIYTTSSNGIGPVKALNQTGTANSNVAPALKGSVIAFYASGLGTINPTLSAGSVPPSSPLSPVTGTVGAFIGGLPAPVQFAGAAPGFPGLYQVNLMVPANAPSGTQPLQINVNGKASQNNTTIEIR